MLLLLHFGMTLITKQSIQMSSYKKQPKGGVTHLNESFPPLQVYKSNDNSLLTMPLILVMKNFKELVYRIFCIILRMVFTKQLILHNAFYGCPQTSIETIHTYFIFKQNYFMFFLITTSFPTSYPYKYLTHFLIIISLLFPTHQHGY